MDSASSDRVDNEDNAYQFGYNVYFSGPFVTYYQDNIRVFYDGQKKQEANGDNEHTQRTEWTEVDTTVYGGVITQTVYDSSKGLQILTLQDDEYWKDTVPKEVGVIVRDAFGYPPTTYYVDWMFIRKYNNPEPVYMIGNEEYLQTEIPEFPSIAVPVMLSVLLFLVFKRRN